LLFPFHKDHHNYISPVCISTYDSHPIECFFWDLFPTFSFALLFGLPIHLLYVTAIMGTIIGLLVHCGYRLVETKTMDMAHHDLHHERMKCNYSTPFVDYVMGTYLYREPDKIYPKFDKTQKDLSNSFNSSYS
jgi:sterol desaturase/sphingolipid hydroxylase (fatty acid hydroxylase superfamily)